MSLHTPGFYRQGSHRNETRLFSLISTESCTILVYCIKTPVYSVETPTDPAAHSKWIEWKGIWEMKLILKEKKSSFLMRSLQMVGWNLPRFVPPDPGEVWVCVSSFTAFQYSRTFAICCVCAFRPRMSGSLIHSKLLSTLFPIVYYLFCFNLFRRLSR